MSPGHWICQMEEKVVLKVLSWCINAHLFWAFTFPFVLVEMEDCLESVSNIHFEP